MAARSTTVTVSNGTSLRLARVMADLAHGIWSEGQEPPGVLRPGETVSWRSESSGFATGTEGAAAYQFVSAQGESVTFGFHWDNPFVGANSYDQSAPDQWSNARDGGYGENAAVSWRIEPSQWHVTNFRPSVHGFHFANSWPQDSTYPIKFGPVSLELGDAANGLCGGMTFAALDFFLGSRPVPARTAAPLPGEALFTYLAARMDDSINLVAFPARLLALIDPDYPDTEDGTRQDLGLVRGRSAVMIREAWPQVKSWVDGGVPAPLCLVTVKDSTDPRDLGKLHQVLVWAYYLTGTAVCLALYDPNHPDDDARFLTFDSRAPELTVEVGCYPSDGPVYCFVTTPYSVVQPNSGIA